MAQCEVFNRCRKNYQIQNIEAIIKIQTGLKGGREAGWASENSTIE